LKNEPAGQTVLLDLGTSAKYVQQHLPGSYWVLRSVLAEALQQLPAAKRYVLSCESGELSRHAAADVVRLTGATVEVLHGGTQAWQVAGLPLEQGATHLASARTDRYRRPYEGTDSPREAMQGYLDWEFGLVDQLARDGTHFFHVI
jgi:rhodanese-related sulfurtransferase